MYRHNRITHQVFRVNGLDNLQEFYGEMLGMTRIEIAPGEIGFSFHPECAQLLFRKSDVTTVESRSNDFFWKIGITLHNLDAAVSHLRSCGLTVPDAIQFRDIGYLTHIVDPNGFKIELLQQGFQGKEKTVPSGHPFAAQATLAHITLRVTDMVAATRFFVDMLGMRLMSVQPVPEHGFCLYFFAWSEEPLPDPDPKGLANREWLWGRPYTLIELQHLFSDGCMIAKTSTSDAGFDGFGHTSDDRDTIRWVSLDDLGRLT